ncbi:hypothetical protein ACO0RG_003457 [Hanseniaspora osmophila]|uniref:Cold sensitive U2 snRNA suppressor 1 n=1 Tax=Hanseniaspora osmophila TaxID=56408 RepID=A0A1E5RF11_9ASCO|nr:Cold sensitive U2 snRNA suppressor 1 [Hanseniaspora osmophila]
MARGNRNKNKNNKTLCADENRLSLANLIATDDVEKLDEEQLKHSFHISKNLQIDHQKDGALKTKSGNMDIAKNIPSTINHRVSKKPKKKSPKKVTELVAVKMQDTSTELHKDRTERAEPFEKKKNHTPPSLLELKTYVSGFSELIQDYDVTSTNPFTNAAIKTNKNAVDVPENWKQKRGYLTSRSLMDKPNFELPDLMKQTGIQELRQIDPFDDPNGGNNNSLKEETRAKIQPKMNVLDLDYKKLYDVIFKIGANWKPDNMLQFGDLYYENREMDFNNTLEGYDKRFRPGKLSESLLSALGLHHNGRLPAWCIMGDATKQKQGGKGNSNKKTETAKPGSSFGEHINCFNNHYTLNVLNKIDKDGVYAQLMRKRKKGAFAGKAGKAGRLNTDNKENGLFGAKINISIELDDVDLKSQENEKDIPEEITKQQVQEQVTELAVNDTITTETVAKDQHVQKEASKKLFEVMQVQSLQDGKHAYKLDRCEKDEQKLKPSKLKTDEISDHKEKEISEEQEFKF